MLSYFSILTLWLCFEISWNLNWIIALSFNRYETYMYMYLDYLIIFSWSWVGFFRRMKEQICWISTELCLLKLNSTRPQLINWRVRARIYASSSWQRTQNSGELGISWTILKEKFKRYGCDWIKIWLILVLYISSPVLVFMHFFIYHYIIVDR